MSDTTVTYSLAYKRSLPGYENVTPFYSISDTVRDNETVQQAYDRLEKIVEGRLEAKIKSLDADVAGR